MEDMAMVSNDTTWYWVFNLKHMLSVSLADNVIVGGGCGRDLKFGVAPKDFDLFISNKQEMNRVTTILDTLKRNNIIDSVQHILIYNESSSDRIKCVWKIKLLGIDVDLIQYRVDDSSEVFKYFDFNLNQYEVIEVNGKYESLFRGDKEATNNRLIAIRKDYTEKRYNKMLDKYLALVKNIRKTYE